MARFQPRSGRCLLVQNERKPFLSTRDFKAATVFHRQKNISRLKARGLRARHVAVKKLPTGECKLYRLAFAESNIDGKWDRVIFTDKSTFIPAKNGPVLVHRPRGQR